MIVPPHWAVSAGLLPRGRPDYPKKSETVATAVREPDPCRLARQVKPVAGYRSWRSAPAFDPCRLARQVKQVAGYRSWRSAPAFDPCRLARQVKQVAG